MKHYQKAIVDLAKGRSTWVRRWMLVDLALFSGLRISEITALRVGDLRLKGSEKLTDDFTAPEVFRCSLRRF